MNLDDRVHLAETDRLHQAPDIDALKLAFQDWHSPLRNLRRAGRVRRVTSHNETACGLTITHEGEAVRTVELKAWAWTGEIVAFFGADVDM